MPWVKCCWYTCQFVNPYCQNHCGSRKSNPIVWEWFLKEQSKRTSIPIHWILDKRGISVRKPPSLLNHLLLSTHSLLFCSVALTWPHCREMMPIDDVTSYSCKIGPWLVSVSFEVSAWNRWLYLHEKVSHLFQRWWGSMGQHLLLEHPFVCHFSGFACSKKIGFLLLFWFLQRTLGYRFWAGSLPVPVATAPPLCDWAPECCRYWLTSAQLFCAIRAQLSHVIGHEDLCGTRQMGFIRAEQCLLLQVTLLTGAYRVHCPA